jgi:hypothetical protein
MTDFPSIPFAVWAIVLLWAVIATAQWVRHRREHLKMIAEHDARIVLLARERRISTDRLYMLEAAISMLGPIGSQVWQQWQEKGVRRVHYSWGERVSEMTGEDRAQAILDMEAAPKELVHNIDGGTDG